VLFPPPQPQAGVQSASASVRGSLLVPANRDVGPLRLSLHDDSGHERPIALEGGTFVVEGLSPGTYRIELRAPRLVFARRVSLEAGEHACLDFSLR
jgi:hypothetical protein